MRLENFDIVNVVFAIIYYKLNDIKEDNNLQILLKVWVKTILGFYWMNEKF